MFYISPKMKGLDPHTQNCDSACVLWPERKG